MMFGSVALQATFGVGAIITPLLTKSFLDKALPARELGMLYVLVIGVAVTGTSTAVLGMLSRLLSLRVGTRVTAELGLRFFNHLQHLPIQFYDNHVTGEIATRSLDLGRSIQFVTGSLHTLGASILFTFAIPPLLAVLNWKLALFSLAAAPLTAGLSLMTAQRVRRRSRESLERTADTSAYQVEILSQIRSVKASGAESEVHGRMKDLLNRARDAQLRAGTLSAFLGGGIGLLKAVGAALYSWFAWSLMIRNELTMGEFVAFSAYIGYLNSPLQQITSLFSSLQQTAASLNRVFEYFDTGCEQDPDRNAIKSPGFLRLIHGPVSLEGVSFSYQPERPVIRDVTVEMDAGTTTAIVGRSGEGKSTIAKLLLRMYQPDSGEIMFGGVAAEQYRLSDLRQQISVVWQETHLFSGTLRENLFFGTANVRPARLDDILGAAQLEDFVSSLPRGLDTRLSELGGTISAGQRARVAIARALLRCSPILVLDEATANLDVQTANAVMEGVRRNSVGKVIVLITHQAAVANLADRVFVLEQGRTWGGEPHSRLMVEDERYVRIWQEGADSVEKADRSRGALSSSAANSSWQGFQSADSEGLVGKFASPSHRFRGDDAT